MVEADRGTALKKIVYSPIGLLGSVSSNVAYIPLPGGATAVYFANTLGWYRHGDWLGGGRLSTTPSRTSYYDVAYASFGERYAQSGTTDLSFTGQNQLTNVNDIYDFLARKYHDKQGRWISPDPAGLAAADLTYPQSWNRYAYVENQPCSFVDPLGLSDCSFNISLRIGDQSLLNAVKTDLQNLFSAYNLGINFVNTGADYTISLVNSFQVNNPIIGVNSSVAANSPRGFTLGVDVGYETGAGVPQGYVFSDRLAGVQGLTGTLSSSGLALAVARVGAHEFGHFILPTSDDNLPGFIMYSGYSLKTLANPAVSLGFTGPQVDVLRARCQQRHGRVGSGGAGIGGPFSGGPGSVEMQCSWVPVTDCGGESCSTVWVLDCGFGSGSPTTKPTL